jgi:hypothetical protein
MREVNADQKSVREFCVTQTLAVVCHRFPKTVLYQAELHPDSNKNAAESIV